MSKARCPGARSEELGDAAVDLSARVDMRYGSRETPLMFPIVSMPARQLEDPT